MYFLIVKRAVKFSRDTKEQFAARSQNVVSWHIDGPFTKKSLAERALVAVLGRHTCLTAQVMSHEQVHQLANRGSDAGRIEYALTNELIEFKKRFPLLAKEKV